jgi:hypothetical protein
MSDTFVPRDHDRGGDALGRGVQVTGIKLLGGGEGANK